MGATGPKVRAVSQSRLAAWVHTAHYRPAAGPLQAAPSKMVLSLALPLVYLYFLLSRLKDTHFTCLFSPLMSTVWIV